MEKIEEESIAMEEETEQRPQQITDQPQNPDVDQMALDVYAQGDNQGLENLEVEMAPENCTENSEDKAVKVNENAEEERRQMATSADSSDDADLEINVEDVDDSSDEEPFSSNFFPRFFEWRKMKQMSAMSTEQPTAAQDAGSSMHAVEESVSHGYRCIDALLNTLTCTCGKKFPKLRSLALHISHFNKERNFQCDYCERHSSSLTLFVNHLKDLHEDEVEPQAPILAEAQRRSRRITKKPERYGQIQGK